VGLQRVQDVRLADPGLAFHAYARGGPRAEVIECCVEALEL
jgi:hypothetical protein